MFRTILLLLLLTLGVAAKEPLNTKLPVQVYMSLPARSAQVLDSFIQEFAQTHTYLDIQVKNFGTPQELYQSLSDPNRPAPTMAIVENSWLPGLVQNQPALYPVETWMPKEQFGMSWAIKNNAQNVLWEASQVNGNLYALPMFFSTRALIYNSDILLKSGIKQVPTTWDQVLLAAKKISDPKASPQKVTLSLGDTPTNIARNFQMLVWQNGGDGLNSTVSANNPVAVQTTIDFFKKLTPGLAPVDGQPAMLPVGMYIGNVEDYLNLRSTGLPVKTAMIPGFDKFTRTTETQGWALAVFKNVPDRELYKVQELAFFITDFQQQLRFAEQTPYLAAHLKVFDNPFYRRERLADHSNLRVFLNSIGKSRIVDTSATQLERYDTAGKSLGPVLRGEKTSQDLLK
ncbi:MAG: extracellular solute-binding protein [Candidatus Eremiobacteraeota bacterium]|nr:extracellular solute-binding protein [Candidatus Eremiobacteraeota bacterium]